MAEIVGQALQVAFYRCEVKTQSLLDPQRVFNQGEPLLFALVAIDEPEQESEQDDN